MTMHPDFKAGLAAYRCGEPFDGARCSQWRQGWRAGKDGAERRAQAMSRDNVERWHAQQYGARWDSSRYEKADALPVGRLVDLNAWIAQNRRAEQTIAALRGFARSIGCRVVDDGIECTPVQASQLERWWVDHAPPAGRADHDGA